MKKIVFLSSIISLLFITWCNTTNTTVPEKEDTVTTNYEQELTIEGTTPLTQDWWIHDDGYLIARKTFEDHTDIILFKPWTRETYFKHESEFLPWNIISFNWEVEFIDWAAWSHYYEVKNIEKLKTIQYPNENEIKEIFNSYSYCDIDEDCTSIYPWCPLGCSIAINNKYETIAQNIADNFKNNQEQPCMYRCLEPKTTICENYQCKTIYDENSNNDINELNE